MEEQIKSIVEFVVGLMLLPTAGAVVVYVSADENLSGIFGLSFVLSASLVVITLGIMYNSVKKFF
jgi:hypothetical protein